jgi:hypothetical protein
MIRISVPTADQKDRQGYDHEVDCRRRKPLFCSFWKETLIGYGFQTITSPTTFCYAQGMVKTIGTNIIDWR